MVFVRNLKIVKIWNKTCEKNHASFLPGCSMSHQHWGRMEFSQRWPTSLFFLSAADRGGRHHIIFHFHFYVSTRDGAGGWFLNVMAGSQRCKKQGAWVRSALLPFFTSFANFWAAYAKKICWNMLTYAVLILWIKKGVPANFYAFCISAGSPVR